MLAALGQGQSPVVDGPTSIERELDRGEALRELSRAQRQLLAALAALESDDRRERDAAALALDHAESRVAHAMAALDRLAERPPDEDIEAAPASPTPAVRRARETGTRQPRERPAPLPLFEGAAALPPDVLDQARRADATSFGEDEIRDYLGELSALARQCATDVGDLRALLQAAGDLESEPGDAPPAAADVAPAAGAAREEPSRAARRREVLRQMAAELSATAVEDLALSMSELDARLDAAARSIPRGTRDARIDALERVVDTRLAAAEERLVAIERRLRWLEDANRAVDIP